MEAQVYHFQKAAIRASRPSPATSAMGRHGVLVLMKLATNLRYERGTSIVHAASV